MNFVCNKYEHTHINFLRLLSSGNLHLCESNVLVESRYLFRSNPTF